MEATQTVEKENYHLRQQVTGLTAKLKQASSSDQAQLATDRVTLVKLRKLQTISMDIKYELQQTKHCQEQELETMRNAMTVAFRSTTAQLLASIMDRDKRILQLETELRSLKETPVVKEVVDTAEQRRQQILLDDARKQIMSLREELTKSEKRKLELTEECRNTKQGCEAALREAKQWNSKYETLVAEFRRLKSRLSVVEYESREAIDAAVKAEIDTREQCEKILVDFESENSFLFKRICELETEVERLTQLSAAPKADNNFAKFVQLKSENVALKTQLNTAVTARKRLALLGGRKNEDPGLGPPSSISSYVNGATTTTMTGPSSQLNPTTADFPDDDENSCFGDGASSIVSTSTRTNMQNGKRHSKTFEPVLVNEGGKIRRSHSTPGSMTPREHDREHDRDHDRDREQEHAQNPQPQPQPHRDSSLRQKHQSRSKPIDDSDDEFSPVRRRQPPPFPGQQPRQKGQATVAEMLHPSSSFDIGVPLLNKQTRTALKERIIV